uniref:Calcium-dependent secretion activator n=1 Tax=Lygus hesperus TaxID=30085 RepID=A0A0A9YRN7_LYGHE
MRQGIFQWVEPVDSPESKKVPVGGLSSVIYNVQTFDLGDEESKVTVDESIQTMLPLETDTLHQMMVASLKDTLFEDFGTQVTPTPEVSPKPSSVVYIENEKKPFRSTSKTQKSELVRSDSKPQASTEENVKLTTDSYCQTLAYHSQQTSTTDMVSKCNNSTQHSRNELKDQDHANFETWYNVEMQRLNS